MEKQTRRELLSNAAKTLPIAAVGLATTPTPAVAAQKGTTSTTAFINSFGPNGGFVGTLTVTGFQLVNGVVSAVGTLSGAVVDATGTTVGTVSSQAVTAPAAVTASCEILTLVLGPLHLNLLGLVIDLNQVVLTINAVPGAGNLLGNLLCAVANLLNNPGTLTNLLNNLVS